ncbi:MAG TPA: serine/threonine-protein kinase [Acidiferrobacterales bacterium]|jgi:serine/threonine-protein kinase
MAKGGFLKRDALVALVLALVFIVAVIADLRLLSNLEAIAYDAGVGMTGRKPGASEQIALITIDDDSIRELGRLPWPRNVLGDMILKLSQARARLIALQILLSEPQTDPGLVQLREIEQFVTDNAGLRRRAPREAAELRNRLARATRELDVDAQLAAALPRARNVLMPMFFQEGRPLGRADQPLPDFVQRNRLTRVVIPPNSGARAPTAVDATVPLEIFGRHIAGVGHLNVLPDSDGAVRTDALVMQYYDEYYPSLALMIAARSLNLDARDISVTLGEHVTLGKLTLETDDRARLYSGFYPRSERREPPFARYSFHEVLSGKIDARTFRDKIVLIGATAQGVGHRLVTPVDRAMPELELTANSVASILNEDFYRRPEWALWAEMGIWLTIVLYLMFMLPRVAAGPGGFVSFVLFAGLLTGAHYLLVTQQLWLQTVAPALLLLTGHLVLVTKRFFVTERLKVQVEADSAQTNRILGLSYQGQGQLDSAMDKFRSLPVDDSVLDLIYNLALDFERKRQFNKAAAAYDYILEHRDKFRDAAERRERARQAENSLIIGGGRAGPGGTLILDGADQKPTLGRYELDRELGKGAMGAVYLGRDPKINRVVAIKTMALSEEFAGSDLADVKARFFREAETAGRLNHPYIVTIYDAGEEHDLAYIAMEYLEGKDLTEFIRPDRLLPVHEAVDIVCKVAEALDYAHQNDVVHRDIKPANIMYDQAKQSVKVTDFGIARITASSRTKTGVILGTPSYMSPEQLAGKHLDGRTDLFSLGVTLFELLTGGQPFNGDSMATLMYQIANERHPDVTRLREGLPSCFKTVLDKMLNKNPDKRYQSGIELRDALLRCQRATVPRKAGAS